ncbi:MAG: O-antigen ligase family protein [Coraliomargarita sp.]
MASPSIAPREWAVVFSGGLTLAFTAWAFAGVQMWSLHTMLAGSALTFLCALAPLPTWMNGVDGEHGNATNLKRLTRFPVFWFGLLLMVYIVIQGLNPAWELKRHDRGWWVEEVEPIGWLPSGVQTEYAKMNAFRVLANFGAAFLLVWGFWVGIRRRKSAVLVLWILVLSGAAMALVAVLQRMADADKVLWLVRSANKHFWGSFFYRNQGVAYLTLIMVASAVLYFYHYNQSERRGQSGGPYMLLFLILALVYASICLALSRGGVLFGGIFVAGFVAFAVGRTLLGSSWRRSVLVSLLAAGLIGSGVYGAYRLVDFEAIAKRFGDVEETIQTADQDSRWICTAITWKMAQEELVFGWGAGSWRYIFPMYQKSYPEIYYQRYHRKKGWIGRRVYHEAHNDLVQYFFELGIVGSVLFLLPFVYWICSLAVRSAGNALSAVMLLLGLTVAFGHAFVDFIFQSPAYWVAFSGMLCISVKLLSLDSERRYG